MFNKIKYLINYIKGVIANKEATSKLVKSINKQTTPTFSKKVKYCVADLMEKYKGMRRILIFVAVAVNIYLVYITVEMYELTQIVDTQWVIFAGYWAGFLSVAIAFYFKERSTEETKQIETGTKVGSEALKEEDAKINQKIATTRNVTVYTDEDNPDFYNDNDFDNIDEKEAE